MQKIYVYAQKHESTSPRIARALIDGLRGRRDAELIFDGAPRAGIWAGFGSPMNWDALQAMAATGFIYADHAYFGRGQYYRLTRDNYQYQGKINPNYARLDNFYPQIAPFSKDGGKILVCPQSVNHFKRFGCPNWLDDTINALCEYTDRDIQIHQKADVVKFSDVLPGTWAVVCHSSMTAIEALMKGIPAFCTAPCSASPMVKSDLSQIENPLYPDGRREWAATLAANQWTLPELAQGAAWEALELDR